MKSTFILTTMHNATSYNAQRSAKRFDYFAKQLPVRARQGKRTS